MKSFSIVIDQNSFKGLYEHLFPGDNDEHGAVITAGIAETTSGTKLLVRDIFLARDGIDYVPGTSGYRALTAQFVAEKSHYCSVENLCYIAVHCHPGTTHVEFSGVDLASQKKGYPALIDITKGGPVGALVFAQNAVAGKIWTKEGCFDLDHMTILGSQIHKLYPYPNTSQLRIDGVYDRHTRLFGDIGQYILSGLTVGIIGLGGGGSLINEWLARLGVGSIVAIDFDKLEPTNLPRVVGASELDAMKWLQNSRFSLFRNLGKKLARRKVDVAKRVAATANPSLRFEGIAANILDESTAKKLTGVDFIFLATDNIQSRLVFNALVHQYLIPGAQIGVKVSADKMSGKITNIVANTRIVIPGNGGCLECHRLIPPDRLQEESLSPKALKAQKYVDDESVAEPSVITLNALSAAQAVNDFMMMFTGLYSSELQLPHQIHFAQERVIRSVDPIYKQNCPDCSMHPMSRRSRGDKARLPCRIKTS
jgi:molybdopterin/thiamine biosynthesis adenylyltransferase